MRTPEEPIPPVGITIEGPDHITITDQAALHRMRRELPTDQPQIQRRAPPTEVRPT